MTARIRLVRGCYVEPEAGLAERCAAALGQASEDCVIAGLAAAALHGFWLPSDSVRPELAATAPDRRSAEMTRMRRPGIAMHRWEIPQSQVTLVNGLPATTLERTWWDLAARLSLPDLVAAGDSALQRGASVRVLEALVRERAHRRGNANARAALPMLDGRSASRPESHLRVAVIQAGLTCFEVNEPVHDRNHGWLATPDLSCRESRIALEYQGVEHADAARMRRDITRATSLRRDDWLVLCYGPAEVFGRPWQIGPELITLHRERSRTRTPARVVS